MSIHINAEACTGCGKCLTACPGTLLTKEDGKAVLRYPEECWGCTACLKECAFGAIRTFLGADIGGRGTELSIRREGPLLHWTFERPDGEKTTITVDSRDANEY